jgi:hypothetical protein
MGPNDVELVRVWTREVGASVADVTFPHNADFQVVVDVEAGTTIFGGGTKYQTGIYVRDLSNFTAIPAAPVPPTVTTQDDMGAASWPNTRHQFVYKVAAADLGAARENHCCEVLAFLRVRVSDPDVTFATSPTFIITRP